MLLNILTQCKNNYGISLRKLSLWERYTYFRVPKPLWLWRNPTDEMTVLFKNLPRLFKNGVVVWGHVIQANQLLFEPGNDNCPGEIVYSIEDSTHATYEYLARVAQDLYSLKGTNPTDPELNSISNYLANEMMRVYGLSVPTRISPNLRCRISSTYFVRKHLPNRRLCSSLLPVIVNPDKPYIAMPLPARYWPSEFIEWWAD